jgi:hypothetical protein
MEYLVILNQNKTKATYDEQQALDPGAGDQSVPSTS